MSPGPLGGVVGSKGSNYGDDLVTKLPVGTRVLNVDHPQPNTE